MNNERDKETKEIIYFFFMRFGDFSKQFDTE